VYERKDGGGAQPRWSIPINEMIEREREGARGAWSAGTVGGERSKASANKASKCAKDRAMRCDDGASGENERRPEQCF